MDKATIPVTVTREISYRDIYSLIITGCEGGDTAVWATLGETVVPDEPDNSWLGTPESNDFDLNPDGSLTYPHYSAPLSGGYTEFIHTYNGDDTVHRMDLEAIKRGLQIMADKYPHIMRDFLNDNSDAVTGDVFIQCCCLGKAVYG